jgi:hypothetical protein
MLSREEKEDEREIGKLIVFLPSISLLFFSLVGCLPPCVCVLCVHVFV